MAYEVILELFLMNLESVWKEKPTEGLHLVMWQVSRDRKYPGMWVVGIWLGLSQESELRTAFLVWGWFDNWGHGIWSLPQGTPDGGGLVFCSKEFRLQWGDLGVLIRQSTETWGTRSWTVSLWCRAARAVCTRDWWVEKEGIKAMWK